MLLMHELSIYMYVITICVIDIYVITIHVIDICEIDIHVITLHAINVCVIDIHMYMLTIKCNRYVIDRYTISHTALNLTLLL